MKFMFVFTHSTPTGYVVGNVDASFPRERPTMNDVRTVEKVIGERNAASVTVTAFFPLGDE